MFDLLRSLGKRVLGRFPAGYRVGQTVFTRVKDICDRRAFMLRHPKADYIQFSQQEIQGFLDQGFHSQYGQDWYLWTKVFIHQSSGTYVDIGGNDPIKLSNSYYFEKQGWKGFAFDPLEPVATAWMNCRSAVFHHAAISDKEEVRNYVEIGVRDGWEHALSGFEGFVRNEDKVRYGYRTYPVKAAPLDTFIPAGAEIDIVMIDVEGAENIVLDGIDLDKLKPIYVMIENVSSIGGSEVIRCRMKDSGYDIVCRIGGADDLYRRHRSADFANT